jgi:hypothetical protein
MGLCDTVYWDCPSCGDTMETQTKPTEIEGMGTEYDAETAPLSVLSRASYMTETCGCGCISAIVGRGDSFAIRASWDLPLDNTQQWQLVDVTPPPNLD